MSKGKRRIRLFRSVTGPPPRLTPEQEKLVGMADRMARQLKRDFYSLGLIWNQLLESAGEAQAQAIWEHYVDLDVREAQRYGALAAEYSAETVGSVPIRKLLKCSSYCKLKGIPIPKDPSGLAIEWTDPAGKPVRKAFRDCTTEDLQAAIDSLRPPRPHRPTGGGTQPTQPEPPIPDDYKKIWQALLDHVHDALAEDPEAVFEMHMVAARKARVRIEVDEDILIEVAQGIVDTAEDQGARQEARKVTRRRPPKGKKR